ncbi:MAG: arginine--tRNA ligase [Candidatus Pacearchaeota archaeon]
MKEAVINVLKKVLDEKGINLKEEEIEKLIEVPPNSEMGDYAFPCFFLSEKLKDEPSQIALEIREKIGEPNATDFEDIQTQGPYINFFLNRKSLARKILWDINFSQKDNYGRTKIGNNKKIVIEFSSPNIAKPFGIGHLRSTIIGNSLTKIFEFLGYKVIKINYLGDWGTQFGKLIFGYKKFGDKKKLKKDPIKHLLYVYVKANQKRYEQKARDEFRKLENGDKENFLLWRLFRNLSLGEFKKIYKKFGIIFDVYDGESFYRSKAKEIIEELKEKKIIKESKGALIVDLEQYGLQTAIIEKSDGTTLYATRDIAAAIDRYKKYNFEKMIYEVGQEQRLYFMQIFKILELMGNTWAKNCFHVYHGFYLDSKGKKFATRKGKTIFLEEIFKKTLSLAKKEILKRKPKISKRDLEKKALKIAIAAIFYGDLKNNRTNNIVFDIKRFISFEGDTGPYLQYSYARAGSILKKVPRKQKKYEIYSLESKEIELIKKISQFPEIVISAGKNFNPSIIANYAYQLAQVFNEFYHSCKVVGSEQEAFRIELVRAFRQTLKNALRLLGIGTVDEM